MNLISKIGSLFLFPFSIIYDVITSLRNFLYDKKILSSIKFNLPIISVGNLSVGGTGKTPMVEYIASYYLSKNYNIALLSRGYKRKTSGFIIANKNENYITIGDEPMQFYFKFQNKLIVTVCEDRKEGINKIIQNYPKINLIILDDAFQQRKIVSSFNIVISNFNKPFFNDYLMPFGRLREKRNNISRGEMVIFSKTPSNTHDEVLNEYKLKSRKYILNDDKIFFSKILYSNPVPFSSNGLSTEVINNVITVSSISDSKLFLDYIRSKYILQKSYNFPDHHIFTINDVTKILSNLNRDTSLIITEKDATKFRNYRSKLYEYSVFILPIKIELCSRKNEFHNRINSYLNSYK